MTFFYYNKQESKGPQILLLNVNYSTDGYYAKYYHQPAQPAQYGYVLALHYSDQMTGSTLNLVSLQCWAHSLGPSVKVVEPFVRRSVLGLDNQHRINMNDTAASEGLKSVALTDVYDEEKWKEFTTGHEGYSPLVSWDNFLEDSPRKMIVVERECMDHHKCMACGDERIKDLLLSMEVLQSRYGFEVVHRICYPLSL